MTDYAHVKAWRKRNPEKVAEQNKRYHKKHPETHKKAALKYRAKNIDILRPKEAAQARARRKADPEGQRIRYERWRAKRLAELEKLAGRTRPDLCEICGECHIRIVFDHCHKHGHFRGWICDRCNRVLGLVKDSPELLGLLANYLLS